MPYFNLASEGGGLIVAIGWTGDWKASFELQNNGSVRVAALRKHLDSYLKVRPIYTGDCYPLTPHTLDTSQWIAWKFYRADLGDGVVQAFRRPDAASETLTVKLRGLDPQLRYDIEDFDGGKEIRTGAELMRGYDITFRQKPAAAVLLLKAIR